MAALQHTTRRALFAAVPTLALVAAVPAMAQAKPVHELDCLRGIARTIKGGEAELDRAIADGMEMSKLWFVMILTDRFAMQFMLPDGESAKYLAVA